ncbi:hypothetical protein IPM62_01260 [Candidatus Woesebacteria bacterium]|nr:MAG: hypothetical protein IPM62_01260 [Candidatus Woesebacteria bacterium]
MTELKTGLDKNTSSALCYVLGPISGVFFLIVDKDPKVRFHAMQSILAIGGLILLQLVLFATLILAQLASLITVAVFVLWLVLIYKAWLGEDWEVPFVGKWAHQALKKV